VTVEYLEDQLAQVGRDLTEVDQQVAAGELDTKTADRLRATYRSEADALRTRLAVQEPAGSKPSMGSRSWIGLAVFAVAAVAVLVLAAVSLVDRSPGGSLTGGVASDVLNGEQPDLAAISNEEMEAVVAANPDIVPMRLALARRYFDAGEFTPALDHYMIILETEQHPEALANVGWMTYLSGRPDVASTFVEEALARDPSYLPAMWFLASIRFEGLGDAAGAVDPLERLLEADGVPDDIRRAAQDLLERVRAAS
jgi:cytochrome c-type biogenesis protein CcmH/NrfG